MTIRSPLNGATAALALIAAAALVAPGAAHAAPNPEATSESAVLAANRPALMASAEDAFTSRGTVVDTDGTRHVRYERSYRGLPVLGGDTVVHFDPDGSLRETSLTLRAPITLSTTATTSAKKATATARTHFRGKIDAEKAELIVDAVTATPRLAWDVTLTGIRSDGTPSRLHVIVDAHSGDVRNAFDTIETATGSGNSLYAGTVSIETTPSGGSYQLKDPLRGNGYACDMNNSQFGGCSTFTDADNIWGNSANTDRASAAVDAHYGAAVTYDYYKNVHGRDGIFGDGRGVASRVHYGNNYVNAFWDGSRMTYGDGNGRPLVSLDVAAHEMSHGVMENTADLIYSGESGGLNEANSDIFAALVEFYAANSADPGDYLVGEKIDVRGDGTPLRYMDDPTKDGKSKGCWYSGVGNLNVHYSSGVGNHFFFTLAVGSGAHTVNGVAYNSPTCNNAPAVTGIGNDKAGRIWYRALTTYMTSSETYAKARLDTVKAAVDLYGAGAECAATKAAWTAVAVPAQTGEPSCAQSGAPVVTDPGDQSTTVGTAVSLPITASDPQGDPLTYSATGLPAGLSINSVTGLITGTPTTTGTSNVTVTATDPSANAGSAGFTWTINPAGGGCTAAQLFGNPGFEGGNATWTASTGVITNSSSRPAHSGSWKAWLNGYGRTHTDSLAQTVSIPAGCTSASLAFWLRIDTSESGSTPYDTLKVQVVDGSATTTLATYSNADAGGGYVQKSFDLSTYIGKTITVKFLGVEDYYAQTSFVIDDTALNIN